MEKAVLLSDIEFLPEVHESDWEQIEEDSFFVNVSKPLNENQKVVLDWLKKTTGKEGSLMRALYSLYHLNLSREDFFKPEVRKPLIEVRAALRKLTRRQEAEVLAAFAEWGMKQA